MKQLITLFLIALIATGCGVLSSDESPANADAYVMNPLVDNVTITYKTNNGEETFNTSEFYDEDEPLTPKYFNVSGVKNPSITATNNSGDVVSFNLTIRSNDSDKPLGSVGVRLAPNDSFTAERGVFAQPR